MEEEYDFGPYHEYDENLRDNCINCNRTYDDIDYEYQSCSKCGYDSESKTFNKPRRPTDADYLAGEADILTGRWY